VELAENVSVRENAKEANGRTKMAEVREKRGCAGTGQAKGEREKGYGLGENSRFYREVAHRDGGVAKGASAETGRGKNVP